MHIAHSQVPRLTIQHIKSDLEIQNKNVYREKFRPPHEQIYAIIGAHVGGEQHVIHSTEILRQNHTFFCYTFSPTLNQLTVYCFIFCNRKNKFLEMLQKMWKQRSMEFLYLKESRKLNIKIRNRWNFKLWATQ